MTNKEKYAACKKFIDELADILSETYELVGSCNKDMSAYLIPKGTIDELTYYSKPSKSFRISDHWNWFSNLNKCSDPHYVQCYNLDIPRCRPRDRNNPMMATKARFGIQVGYIGKDQIYRCVFGACFDRKTKTWKWIEADPSTVIANCDI